MQIGWGYKMADVIYKWFKVYKVSNFTNLEVPALEVEVLLQNYGKKTITICKGQFISVIIDGVFLTPIIGGGYLNRYDRSAHIDADGYLWIGIKV